MEEIKVSLPVNVTCEEKSLFELYLSYNFDYPKVRFFEGAFVTSTGLVCADEIIKECYHHTWKLQYEACLRDALIFYDNAKNNPNNLITFDDDETYLVAHHPWFGNYYHWINETILRLWMVKDQSSNMILLLPSEEQLPPFAKTSLKIFNFKDIFYIPPEKSVLVRNLCMPELKPTMASYHSQSLQSLNETFTTYVNLKTSVDVNLGERIYVSRRKYKRRWISNEDEVIALVAKYDFKIVYNEDYSFFEQVSFYSKAKYLITIHGAGMTNMLFMQKNSQILELYKRWVNPLDKHNFVFWYLADSLGHTYYHQACEPTDPAEHYFTANINVNIDLLEKNLKMMIS